MKGCVISASMTGAGKTTVTLGILAALRRRGVAVPDVGPLARHVAGGGLLPEQLAVAGPHAQDVALATTLGGGGR